MTTKYVIHHSPVEERRFYVYILANEWNTVTYVGVTNDLIRRVYEHREKIVEGFTKRYGVAKLVHYEIFGTALEAIAREKQLKAGSRQKKVAIIERTNPEWRDLYNTIAV